MEPLKHKREWNLAICNNMDGLRGWYIEWNKSEREILYAFTYMWNLKTKPNKTKTESKLMVSRGEEGGALTE